MESTHNSHSPLSDATRDNPVSLSDSTFRIVEYSPDRAASLADMWNRSAVNWGGGSTVHTKESILAEHVGSINLTEFLAVDAQNEVIGFCSFSRYAQDRGALYIPLLNVRPDWHGRKVGKSLVLSAVKRTVELGWPRLDLYTWPGNTKAVPTYKKCGFFWERRDDTTHLMNFIPTVLNAKWLEPFFQTADWYADAIRDIRVEPDGQEENGFHLYEYAWQHGDNMARAGFERTGRGLCMVETDTFRVSMSLDAHQVVANRSAPVRIHVRNKGGTPMQVTLRGLADGAVRTEAAAQAWVETAATLEGRFVPDLLPRPQNRMQTHPRVTVEVTIDGVSATLQMGVEIRPPAIFKVQAAHVPALPGMRREGVLDIENCFKEPVSFLFTFPETAVLNPVERACHISLGAGEKRSFPFPHHILSNGFWDVSVPVEATLSSGETHRFEAPLRMVVNGWRGRFFGETDEHWLMANGPFLWHLQKDGGGGTISSHGYDESTTRFECPSLGRPYSNEFKTLPAERVTHQLEEDCVVQRASFVSGDFPGLTVVATTRLWAHGELERTLSVRNDTDAPLLRPAHLAENVWHDLRLAVLPYDGTYLEISDETEQDYDLYDAARLTENWIFTRGEQFTRGLCWSTAQKPAFHHGLVFEHEVGLLEAGATREASPLRMACGFFSQWQDFRQYAHPQPTPVRLASQRMLCGLVNGGNPFLHPATQAAEPLPCPVRIEQHANIRLDGTVEVSLDGANTLITRQAADEESTVLLQVPIPARPSPACLDIRIRNTDNTLTLQRCVIPTGDTALSRTTTVEEGHTVLHVGNGPLRIGLSQDFSHALMSFQVNGREWLDTSFPTPGPRSWWGSWPGGISVIPWEVQHATAHAAICSAEFATLTDTLGNRWEGLSATLTIGRHPRLEGLTLTTWYLMLPEAPVLAIVTRVRNGTGRWLNDESLGCQCFFRPHQDLSTCWFESPDSSEAMRRYRGGLSRIDINAPHSILFGLDGAAELLQPVVDIRHGKQMAIANTEALGWMKTLCVTASDGGEGFTDPVFLLATTKRLSEHALADLSNIRFA